MFIFQRLGPSLNRYLCKLERLGPTNEIDAFDIFKHCLDEAFCVFHPILMYEERQFFNILDTLDKDELLQVLLSAKCEKETLAELSDILNNEEKQLVNGLSTMLLCKSW